MANRSDLVSFTLHGLPSSRQQNPTQKPGIFFVQTRTKQELPQTFNPATMASAKSKSAVVNDSAPWSD